MAAHNISLAGTAALLAITCGTDGATRHPELGGL